MRAGSLGGFLGISLSHTAEVGKSHRMSAAMSDGVVVERNMVFNTIACWNTHLNGSVGVVMTSCTSTAGEEDISSIAMLQQRARRRMETGDWFLLTAERFVATSITVLKQFRHSLRSAMYYYLFQKWNMPANSLQSLMLTMSTDMITSVQKSSSRASPTIVLVVSTVAVSALDKPTAEMHKQMSSVSFTYAVIPRTFMEQMLVRASEMPVKINSQVSIQYASTVGRTCKNHYTHR